MTTLSLKTLQIALSILVILLSVKNSWAEFPTGKIVEKVECELAPDFSYALYLPTKYNAEKKWPVLFCFDARAHGNTPAELFREAAEKYGYIIVSSNNSGSDDPSVPNLQAMKAMYDDSSKRFSLNMQRLYATGFSGGARIACDMGFRYAGQVAGVIGCGAGFPTDRLPSQDTPFAYFATIGNLDFNYAEMRQLVPKLESSGIPFKIRTFDSDHSWPTAPICTEAIEWMEVQAMKSGKREKDAALIEELFQIRIKKAESLKTQSILHEAANEFQSIATDYESLHDVTSISAEASRLNALDEVKRWNQEEKKRDQIDIQFRQKFASVNQSIRNSSSAVPRIEKVLAFLEIPELKEKAKSAPSKDDRLLAQRLLEAVTVQHGFYMSRTFMEYGDYARAVLTLSVASEIHPEDPMLWYYLGCAQAQLGEKEKALNSLKRAMENGFKDADKMANDFDLKSLQEEKQFKKILNEIRKKTS